MDRSTAKLVNRLTAMLVNCLTAKLVVVNLVKLHLTKFNANHVSSNWAQGIVLLKGEKSILDKSISSR